MKISKIALSSILLGMLVFRAEGMNATSGTNSSLNLDKIKNQRRGSIALLPSVQKDEKRKSMSIQDHFNLIEKFSSANGKILSTRMKKEYNNLVKNLRILGRIFGYKKYPNSEEQGNKQPEILSVDISYPNLLRVVKEHLKKKYPNWAEIEGKEPWNHRPYTEEHLKWILDRFECVANRVSLTPERIDLLIKLTVGIRRSAWDQSNQLFVVDLFRKDVSEDDLNNFVENLKNILRNKTGAQRVMSLLVLSMCNKIELNMFDSDITSIAITFDKRNENKYIRKEKAINFNPDGKADIEDSVLHHEMTHVYHDMIDSYGITRVPSWVFNYSMVNSPDINLLEEFFPMLVEKNMNPMLKKIKEYITNHKKRSWENVNEVKINGIPISSLIDRVVMNGFGSLLFGSEPPESAMTYEKLLNNEDLLPKLIYLCALNFPAKKNGRGGYLWGNSEEKITMRGNNLFWLDGHYFMLEDRQNEHIYEVRKKNESGKIDAGGYYRFHTSKASISKKLNRLLSALFESKPKENQALENEEKWTPKYTKYVIANDKNDETNDNVEDYRSSAIDLNENEIEKIEPQYLKGQIPTYDFDKRNDRKMFFYDFEKDLVDIKDPPVLTAIEKIKSFGEKAEFVTKLIQVLHKKNLSIASLASYYNHFVGLYFSLEPNTVENDILISELQQLMDTEAFKRDSNSFVHCIHHILTTIDFVNIKDTDENNIKAIVNNISEKTDHRYGTVYEREVLTPEGEVNFKKLKTLLQICEEVRYERSASNQKLKDYVKAHKEELTWNMEIPLLETYGDKEINQFIKDNKNNLRTADYEFMFEKFRQRKDLSADTIKCLALCSNATPEWVLDKLPLQELSEEEMKNLVKKFPISARWDFVYHSPNDEKLLKIVLKSYQDDITDENRSEVMEAAQKTHLWGDKSLFKGEIEKLYNNIVGTQEK